VEKHCDARERALLSNCYIGLRISELLSLTIQDVVNSEGKPLATVQVEKSNTKGSIETRRVTLHPAAGKALAAYALELLAAGAKPNQALFQGRKNKGKAITRQTANRLLKIVFEKCDSLKKDNNSKRTLGTHCLRKTFAQEMYESCKGAIAVVQKLLGHKNINSTSSYLSFNDSELRDAILAME
jgi:integrase/recombinase XerD